MNKHRGPFEAFIWCNGPSKKKKKQHFSFRKMNYEGIAADANWLYQYQLIKCNPIDYVYVHNIS